MTVFQNPQPSIGIGLRSKYLNYFLADVSPSPIRWLEVHPENYLYHYPNRKKLTTIADKFPISFHCVSLSLGSPALPPKEHLEKVKQLINEINPFILSDHLSWNTLDGYSYNDLYPIPLTQESLNHMIQQTQYIQEYFNRQLFLENPSTYLTFQNDTYTEYEFLNELTNATGCGILLDLNNLYVQAENHGWDIYAYLSNLNWEPVKEIHLAGHIQAYSEDFLIDTHNRSVCQEVWDLYKIALQYKFDIYTLIEWDDDLPDIQILIDHAQQAADIKETIYA
jgi:uncharacterized protein (UPF0276 family)